MSEKCFDGPAEKIDPGQASVAQISEHLFKDTYPNLSCSVSQDRTNTKDAVDVFSSLTPEKAKAVNDDYKQDHVSSFLLVTASTPFLASSERMQVANKLGIQTEDEVHHQLDLEVAPLKR